MASRLPPLGPTAPPGIGGGVASHVVVPIRPDVNGSSFSRHGRRPDLPHVTSTTGAGRFVERAGGLLRYAGTERSPPAGFQPPRRNLLRDFLERIGLSWTKPIQLEFAFGEEGEPVRRLVSVITRRVDKGELDNLVHILGVDDNAFWSQLFLPRLTTAASHHFKIRTSLPVDSALRRKSVAYAAVDWLNLSFLAAKADMGNSRSLISWIGFDRWLDLLESLDWHDESRRLVLALVSVAEARVGSTSLAEWFGRDRLLSVSSYFGRPSEAGRLLRAVSLVAGGDQPTPQFFDAITPDTILLAGQRLQDLAPVYINRWALILRRLSRWVDVQQRTDSPRPLAQMTDIPNEFNRAAAGTLAGLPRRHSPKEAGRALQFLTAVEGRRAYARVVARQMVFNGLLPRERERDHARQLGLKDEKSVQQAFRAAWSRKGFEQRVIDLRLLPRDLQPPQGSGGQRRHKK